MRHLTFQLYLQLCSNRQCLSRSPAGEGVDYSEPFRRKPRFSQMIFVYITLVALAVAPAAGSFSWGMCSYVGTVCDEEQYCSEYKYPNSCYPVSDGTYTSVGCVTVSGVESVASYHGYTDSSCQTSYVGVDFVFPTGVCDSSGNSYHCGSAGNSRPLAVSSVVTILLLLLL